MEKLSSYGAVVLCGGKSTRMGTSKAMLPFGDEVMLQRVVRIIGGVVPLENVVVVAAANQQLPQLPNDVLVTRDDREARGPLEGLAAGLRVMPDRVEAAYASGCDVPLLEPKFVTEMFRRVRLSGANICVPKDQKFHHPLAAVYHANVLPSVEALLAADRLRPFFLFEQCTTHEVPVDELQSVDPELRSLMNLNRPEDYQTALRLAGLSSG